MNRFLAATLGSTTRALCGVVTAATFFSAGAAAVAAEQGVQVHTLFASGHDADDEGVWVGADQHSVAITIDDGEMKVVVDGKEIPVDRIRTEGGSIVILDEDGKPIESLRVDVGAGNVRFGQRDLWFGTPGGTVESAEPRIFMGVHLDAPGPALERHLRLESGTTTMITALYEGLPAHKAGLQQYDVITKVDGAWPATSETIQKAMADREAGEVVRLHVISHGEPKVVEVTLAEFDAKAIQNATVIGDVQIAAELTPFGMDLTNPGGNRLFVAPGGNRIERFEQIMPRIEGWQQRWTDRDDTQRDETVDRLERLDERLDELEKMLDRLLEEARRR